MDTEISEELKNLIKEKIFYTEDEAQELLEVYETVESITWDLLMELKDEHEGSLFEANSSKTRGLLASIGQALRVRNELERTLLQIVRHRNTDKWEHKDDRRADENEAIIKLTSSQLRGLNHAKNRQHKNRTSKRHSGVPSESSNHDD